MCVPGREKTQLFSYINQKTNLLSLGKQIWNLNFSVVSYLETVIYMVQRPWISALRPGPLKRSFCVSACCFRFGVPLLKKGLCLDFLVELLWRRSCTLCILKLVLSGRERASPVRLTSYVTANSPLVNEVQQSPPELSQLLHWQLSCGWKMPFLYWLVGTLLY